jgi:hypothetical protein
MVHMLRPMLLLCRAWLCSQHRCQLMPACKPPCPVSQRMPGQLVQSAQVSSLAAQSAGS